MMDMIDQPTLSSAPGSDDDSAVPLFDRIGAMLVRHGLDPTPAHYAICHRYLTDPDSIYSIAIDQLVAESGGLTARSIATLESLDGTDATAVSAETLQGMADEATAYLDRVTGIVNDTGRDAEAYTDALASRAAELPRADAISLGALVTLTRRMIDRSRDAGDHLRRTGTELEALRSKLIEARHSADSDALTGLPNRRALDARMTRACATARSTGAPLAIAICDIDHFKRVNDVHGHLVGDEVIKLVATALAGSGDAFVSRYGGEEFVVLFEGSTIEAAAARVDAIRRTVAARDIKITATGRRLGRVTFSAGVALLRPRGSASAMLKRADAALYRAKGEGRDRVLTETERTG